MKILVPSDHARFWASMCVQHSESVRRIDDNMNALLIVRPWVGKSAESLAHDLKNAARSLKWDVDEPWAAVVREEQAINKEDGWAHADDSLEGMMRELKGMLEHDRHEQLIEAFEKQQTAQSDAVHAAAQKRIDDRGGHGIINETVEILTEAQVKERGQKLKKGKAPVANRDQREQTEKPSQERMKKYRS